MPLLGRQAGGVAPVRLVVEVDPRLVGHHPREDGEERLRGVRPVAPWAVGLSSSQTVTGVLKL
jgi:hypothetical protein